MHRPLTVPALVLRGHLAFSDTNIFHSINRTIYSINKSFVLRMYIHDVLTPNQCCVLVDGIIKSENVECGTSEENVIELGRHFIFIYDTE